MTIGANDLIEKYGTPTDIAVAMIEGKLEPYEEGYAREVVGKIHVAAAKARLELQEMKKL